MNMFSMKPKFDLAAFLAVPAPVGTARARAKRRGMQTGFGAGSATPTDKPETPTDAPETDTPAKT